MKKKRDDPLQRSRQIKKRRRLDRWLWFALGLVLIAVAALLLLNSDRLAISEIKVTGARTVSATAVEQLVNTTLVGRYPWLVSRRNVWFYPQPEVAAAILKNFPTIGAVSLQVADKTRLQVLLRERSPVARWCADETLMTCYLADETGDLYAVAPQFSAGVFRTFVDGLNTEPLGTSPLPAALFDQLLNFQLDHFVISQITRAADPDYVLSAASEAAPEHPFQILVSSDLDLNQAATDAAAALAAPAIADHLSAGANLEYLDLRFLPKVFYKFQTVI